MAPTSSSREIQYSSASAGVYGTGYLHVSRDQPWKLTDQQLAQNEQQQEDSSLLMTPCTYLKQGVSLRVAPMERQTGGWSDIHFHPQLRLPTFQHSQQEQQQGMTILLEAKARECVAVALSPDASFCIGKTYVIHFGASGNVSTVIRRRIPRNVHIDNDDDRPERHSIQRPSNNHPFSNESIDISFPSRVCSERNWISYWICWIPTSCQVWVGVGKVPGQRCIGFLEDSDNSMSEVSLRYAGLGNSGLGRQAQAIHYRNVIVTSLPADVLEIFDNRIRDNQDFPMVMVDDDNSNYQHGNESGSQDLETKALMEEYQEECRKSKARAKKFGIPYKEPPPEAFFQWSKARRLRANPRKGFATGMDIMSPDEVAKQEARKRRFGITEGNDGNKEYATTDEQNDDGKQTGNLHAEGSNEVLAILQAWDNEEFVRGHRVDPPEQIWSQPPPPQDEVIEPSDVVVALVPEKIHMFTIDWAAFKQIRTDDIMAYFSVYGPTYVEWMGELSCNILFEDKYSAARALHHMSTEIPTPPPEEIATTRTSASDDTDDLNIPPDLGRMGWRLCKQPIRKLANDRFGRRGTRARILMRLANTMDVLAERPMAQPPPPGFSTRRVLGPGSEFETGPQRKRHKPDGNEAREGIETEEVLLAGNEPALLNRALTSERSGFTIEQMEAERQAARQRHSQQEAILLETNDDEEY